MFILKLPEGFATTSTGQFPVMIIYGMAGMAGVAGIAVFIVSEKKRKGDIKAGNVQTGIDPTQLVGADTSTGSGGYKTNRGEAHLKSDDYAHHRSVYDEQPQVEQKLNQHQQKKQKLMTQVHQVLEVPTKRLETRIIVRAGRNPLSVLHIIPLCSLPEPDAEFYSSVWLCSLWVRFLILFLEISDFVLIVHSKRDFFLLCCQPSLIAHLRTTISARREEFPLS